MSDPREPIPLNVITGFLGSGKTTLLNQLLGDLKNTAIIVNEFGEVGIDHLLVETADEGLVELSDGCLCCTIRGDLVDTLLRLLQRNDEQAPIDRIVIETTGLADPAPILHMMMAHGVLVERIRLDGVITLVDAVNGWSTLNLHHEAVKQVAMADRIVLSKGQMVTDKAALQDLIRRLAKLNPTAVIIDAGNVSTDQLFGCGLYNPTSKSIDVVRWLREEAVMAAENNHSHAHDVNRHDASIRAFTLMHDKPIDPDALQGFFDLLCSVHGPQLLRMKGILQLSDNPDQPMVIHAVQHIFHPSVRLPKWPGEDRRTRLVIITNGLSKSFVSKLFDTFTGKLAPDTPDRTAMEHNPLVIPGP